MKNNWKYIDFFDLVSAQIEVTRLSYDTHSSEYARDWEWNDNLIKITKRDYLDPFVKWIKPKGVLLVVGCGTGRDLKELGKLGFRYLGIDSSEGMLKEAVEKRKVDGPLLCSDFESAKLGGNSYDGLLCDSAIEHMKKSDMKKILEQIFDCLKIGGIALIRFREGNGKVFQVEDSVGVRYFTSYTASESELLVKSNGFTVVDSYVTKHYEELRPGFRTYILRK